MQGSTCGRHFCSVCNSYTNLIQYAFLAYPLRQHKGGVVPPFHYMQPPDTRMDEGTQAVATYVAQCSL